MRTSFRRFLAAWLAATGLGLVVNAQTPQTAPPVEKGSKTPVAPTPAQVATLRNGINRQSQGQFDESIVIFQGVLKENPDCLVCIIEIANSYLGKKEYAKVIETVTSGLVYKSPDVAALYNALGGAYDAMGYADKAIDTYKEGIAVAPAGLLYFSLAQTYGKQGNDAEALANLKKAAYLTPNHPSTQLLLGALFQKRGYLTQALLAFSRFLILEPTSARTTTGYGPWVSGWQGGARIDAEKNVTVLTRPPADTREGDFGQMDREAATSRAAALKEFNGNGAVPLLVSQLNQWMATLASTTQPADRSAFAWRYYVPYFTELQKRGYVEPFVYWVSQRVSGAGVQEWIAVEANRQRAMEFVRWSQQYQ